MQELTGKIALVTGAGQGIGQGIALALAREGVDVVLAGRSLDKVARTAEMAMERGVRALPLACNVKDPNDLAVAVERCANDLGGIDKRWPGETGQRDKWIFCLTAAMVAA
jgi:NAD(P)-dependent dehydrogenase (short-subunit alcohol dehydrogenase family)